MQLQFRVRKMGASSGGMLTLGLVSETCSPQKIFRWEAHCRKTRKEIRGWFEFPVVALDSSYLGYSGCKCRCTYVLVVVPQHEQSIQHHHNPSHHVAARGSSTSSSPSLFTFYQGHENFLLVKIPISITSPCQVARSGRVGYCINWFLHRNVFGYLLLILQCVVSQGGSGVGVGDFSEIGPLNEHLQPREYSWVEIADLLFVVSFLK